MNLLTPNLPQQLTFSSALLSAPKSLFLHNNLSLSHPPTPTHGHPKTTIIRMGGGPRTYPGGVSKWQWKRMQAKKAKQLLKARLCRERQMYEMRKRAELKAAVSELERPWEVVERAPNLFSVKADEQLKVLADRFQKPGGFDMWTERDGPQLFETPDELPSARFFPKGVVHSIKPYRKINRSEELGGGDVEEEVERRRKLSGVEDVRSDGSDGESSDFLKNVESSFNDGVNGMRNDGMLRKKESGRKFLSKDVNGSDGESSSDLKNMESSVNDGVNRMRTAGKLRKKGNGRKLLSRDVNAAEGEKKSYPLQYEESSFSNGMNGMRIDGGLRAKGNGRKFVSKDVDGSNRFYSGRVGSGRKERGGNSIAGSGNGKFSKRTSGYGSPKVKDTDSEVYDMGLQQDGSYGFRQKSDQFDSKLGENTGL